MNIVGIITIISMILGLLASKYLKGVIYPNPNRNYSKLNNLCMRLAPCDTWTYKGSMYTDIHWNKNVKRAEKSCNKTGEFTGDYEFRNKYKCFFDKTTDKDYPTCMDCATQVTNKITNEMECGKPGHHCLGLHHPCRFSALRRKSFGGFWRSRRRVGRGHLAEPDRGAELTAAEVSRQVIASSGFGSSASRTKPRRTCAFSRRWHKHAAAYASGSSRISDHVSFMCFTVSSCPCSTLVMCWRSSSEQRTC